MSLPTSRISLNSRERAAILPGLKIILNRCAEFKLGLCQPPERIFPFLATKFQPRAYDPEMNDTILKLRNRLMAVPAEATIKPFLNCTEFAMAALAVRISRKRGFETAQDDAIDQKLEKFRKRAKRATLQRLGPEGYQAAQRQWKSFHNWIRFQILPLHIPIQPFSRKHRREQREALVRLALEVIDQRAEASIDEARLRHLVDLAIREVRRKRHENIKVRRLVANPDLAHDFLFEFIKKREPQIKLRHENRSAADQTAIRGEQIRAATRVPSSPGEEDDVLAIDTISEQKVIQRLARLFREEVPAQEWESVAEQANYMAPRYPYNIRLGKVKSMDDLVRQLEPKRTIENAPDHINYCVEWLLGVLFAMNASPDRAARLVRGGWVLASQQRDNRGANGSKLDISKRYA